MTALQTINLGTAPAGSDGDTVRSGFAKVNTNVGILNTQAALSSAAPQTGATVVLDNTYLGRRVTLQPTAAAALTWPKASTCGADSVILVINASAFTVTHSVQSGDSFVNAVAFAPWESALVTTDGVSKWSVLIRSRAGTANEQVSGNLSVSGSVTSNGSAVSSSSGSVTASMSAPAGSYRQNLYNTGSSLRWAEGVESSAETGSNAGSNYFVSRYSDTGAYLDTPFQISRSTGIVSTSKRPVFNGNTAWDSGNFNPASYLPIAAGATSALTGALYCPSVVVNNGSPFQAKDSNGLVWPLLAISGDNFPTIYNPFGTHIRIVNKAYNREIFSCDDSGNVTIGGALTQGSDSRLKTDVVTIADALTRICAVRGVEYTHVISGERQYGVIAQEVQPQFPHAVSPLADALSDNGYLGVNYMSLIGPLVEAVKDLAARVAALEAKQV